MLAFLFLETVGMIAEGVKYLERICGKMKDKATPQHSSVSANSSLAPSLNCKATSTYKVAKTTSTGVWICRQCHEENGGSSLFCKYCGTHK